MNDRRHPDFRDSEVEIADSVFDIFDSRLDNYDSDLDIHDSELEIAYSDFQSCPSPKARTALNSRCQLAKAMMAALRSGTSF